MRFFFKKNGRIAAFDDNQLTKTEIKNKIVEAYEMLASTKQHKELELAKKALEVVGSDDLEKYQSAVNRVDIAKSEYEACEEYIYLERAKLTKSWVPDDAIEMTNKEIDEHLNPVTTVEQRATVARKQRDDLINQFLWRYERHDRETRLGIELTDSIAVLDAYVQALADLTQQAGFPTDIDWPTAPV